MPTTRPRRPAVTAALALGLALVPAGALALVPAGATVAGAASGLATPTTPPPPGPPVGPGGISTTLPLLTVELDDAVEADGAVPGRVALSSAVADELAVTVGVDAGFDHGLTVHIPAGATEASFLYDVAEDDGPEDAQVVTASIDAVLPAGRVRTGPADEAVLYDGDGLHLSIVDDPEALEGDPGSAGTLELVVQADQAVPHPVSARVHTGLAGGPGAALAPADFTPVDLVAQLAPGQTELTVEVPLAGDQLNEEPYELLHAYVGDPSHGEIAFDGGTTLARILDDDGPLVTWERPGGYQSPSRSARSAAFTA